MPTSHLPLSTSAQIVQEALAQKGMDFKVFELAASTRTANEAAAAIGCNVAQIIKSLIFRTQKTHQPILVLASGINRVNEKTIEKIAKEKMTKADADFTRNVTGFTIGGIPPIGHKQPLRTYIDKDLLKFDDLWAAAGTPHAVFCLKSKDLQQLTNGTVLEIK